MNVLIRTDCSSHMGTGHLMRCMVLALALKEHGARVIFVLRQLVGNRIEFIKNSGFEVYVLPSRDADNVLDWQKDAEATIHFIKQLDQIMDWIIVDHYQIDAQWEKQLVPFTKKIMVIDDLANREHQCDLLLDQNIHDDQTIRYMNLVPQATDLLLGPTYALLRKEFHQHRLEQFDHKGAVNRLLVFFGGGDNATITKNALQSLLKLNLPRLQIDVIVGEASSCLESIEEMCKAIPNVNFHCQVSNMAKLMREADLALGAGGSTTWERCCMGLPSIVISVAENQETISRTADAKGLLKYLGRSQDVSVEKIHETMNELINNPDVLINMSRKAMHQVDGLGSEKVVTRLMNIYV